MKEQQKKSDEKSVNIKKAFGMAGGAMAGGIIGVLVGYFVKDIALYAGFGMMVGLALAVDIQVYIEKRDKTAEQDEK